MRILAKCLKAVQFRQAGDRRKGHVWGTFRTFINRLYSHKSRLTDLWRSLIGYREP